MLHPVQEPRILLSCEHAGNALPPAFRALFAGHAALLESHRGFDIGALDLARRLAQTLCLPLFYATSSRLLVDLNRSPGHRQLFSAPIRALPARQREAILAHSYHPYRNAIRSWITAAIAAGPPVTHISVHSFTPELDGRARRCDIGLLHDPARDRERNFCLAWQAGLRRLDPALVVRRNFPYRGTADGLVTALRREFPPERYAGIELEVNQRHALGDPAAWQRLLGLIAAALPWDHRG